MFLILGRPRSRTAWAANLLSVPPTSLCLHEGLADTGVNVLRLRDRMVALPYDEVGNADTGLIHHLDSVLSAFPEARLVLMTGDEQSWRRWCARTGMRREIQEQIEADYRRAALRLGQRAYLADCREITVDAAAAKRLWNHCLPNQKFDRRRWDMLRHLNIQVIPESLAVRLRLSGGLQTRVGL